jgi:predicted kinase
MDNVIILRGLPGSGKTTYAEKFFQGAEVVSADHFFMVVGEYKYDPAKIGDAHANCFRRFVRLMIQGFQDVVVDNTNISAWEISPYILAANAYNYQPTILEFECDEETALKRNIHGVTEDTIRGMAMRMEAERLPPFWKWTGVPAGELKGV